MCDEFVVDERHEFLGFCDGLKGMSLDDLNALKRSLLDHISADVHELHAVRVEISKREAAEE